MDDLTLLDVAIMLNHNEVALMLLKFGAQENPRLISPTARLKHLQTITDAAQTKLAELNLNSKQNSPAKNVEKKISVLESRVHMLKKMRNNFENSGIPDPPKNVALHVASSTSLSVSFEPPEQNINCVVTKYKIEWSLSGEFDRLEGSLLVKDLRRLEVTVNSLTSGELYYVRVSAGNFKGYSESVPSHPNFARPSSWRELDSKESRSAGRLQAITALYHEINSLKSSNVWNKFFTPNDQALKKKKNSFKNIFLSGSKFQKSLKRGVYLASILYKDDKVLCSVDENLPIIEVDETQPSSIIADYLWFMKLSCSWDDMKSLNFADFDQAQRSSSCLTFRSKLLEAASAMQAALGVQDLGRLHCSPIIDNKGVTIFVTVQYVQDQKSVQGLTVKWLQISKLFKRLSTTAATTSDKEIGALDLLCANLLNVLNFYESTYIPLDKGLYLGYVKLHSTMNQISIVVPENLPSVLPFFYIRDNPHVSREEWEWLRILDTGQTADVNPTPAQLSFHWALSSAAKILLSDLDVADQDLGSYRIYRLEVVEVHSDVSFILLVPAHAEVCSAPGQQRSLVDEKRGCFALPVPMFEVAHLCTYQPDFIALYCRLSVFLEFYATVLQQIQRQTLNDAESKHLKRQLDALTNHQNRLDDIWKTARWISSVATCARDRQSNAGLPLSVLFQYSSTYSHNYHPAVNNGDSEAAGCSTLANDNEEAAAEASTSTATVAANCDVPILRHRRRQRRDNLHDDDDQSLSDHGGEDSSDVGYHSDQSLEKLNNFRREGQNVNGEKSAVVTPPTTIFSSHCSTEVFFGKGVDNPIYDQLTPTFFRNCHDSPKRRNTSDSDTISFVTHMNSVQRCYQSKMLQQRYGGQTGKIDLCGSNSDSSPTSSPTQFASKSSTTYRTKIAVGKNGTTPNLSQSPQHYGSFVSLPCNRDSVAGGEQLPASDISCMINKRREYVNFLGSPTSVFRRLECHDESSNGDSDITKFKRFESSDNVHDSDNNVSATGNSSVAEMAAFFQRFGATNFPVNVSDDVHDSQQGVKFSHDAPSSPKRFEANDRELDDDVSSTGGASVAEMAAYFQTFSDCGAPTAGSTTFFSTSTSFNRDPASATSAKRPASAPCSVGGLLRVYAAYPCGLAKGTSVKLQVTPKTTCKEVVTLVVQQLNKAVKMKGLPGPYYSEGETSVTFCLVAVIGARERCLRDDFAPLDLQNPWSKGKLFVRKRSDLLAALEFGNEAKV